MKKHVRNKIPIQPEIGVTWSEPVPNPAPLGHQGASASVGPKKISPV